MGEVSPLPNLNALSFHSLGERSDSTLGCSDQRVTAERLVPVSNLAELLELVVEVSLEGLLLKVSAVFVLESRLFGLSAILLLRVCEANLVS